MATTPVPTERRLVAEHIPFKPEELDFFAEEELVSILPKFTLRQEQGKLHLLDGAYGPLRANTPAKVPLWVALSLRRKNKARIQPPEWMSVANLEKVLEAERKGVDLQDMPHRYIEVAGLLLRFAPQDFGADLPKVRSTLRSIREVRMSKLEREVQEELNRTWAVKAIPLPISSMEANAIRPLLVAEVAWA
ncbi:unnamed protein product [Pedinophyceae sp. YPF-701]|nr:unnamed protein product [Pedinophyceae sp. YPF-701]